MNQNKNEKAPAAAGRCNQPRLTGGARDWNAVAGEPGSLTSCASTISCLRNATLEKSPGKSNAATPGPDAGFSLAAGARHTVPEVE